MNDYWKIEGIDAYPDAIIEVYNRWGKNVFHCSGSEFNQKQWKGKADNGKDLPMDAYYYIIDLKNGSKSLSGTITIIR